MMIIKTKHWKIYFRRRNEKLFNEILVLKILNEYIITMKTESQTCYPTSPTTYSGYYNDPNQVVCIYQNGLY